MLNINTGRMGLTEKKYAKLLNDLRAVMTWDSATQRLASNVLGKLQAYANCLEGVRPFAIPFTLFIGTAKSMEERDMSSRDVQGMKRAAD